MHQIFLELFLKVLKYNQLYVSLLIRSRQIELSVLYFYILILEYIIFYY